MSADLPTQQRPAPVRRARHDARRADIRTREHATAEDDGWIMAVWYDPTRNASELVILAAQDFDGEPVARALLDHRVAPGFHGTWIPRSANGALVSTLPSPTSASVKRLPRP